ncbi:MAG: nucleoside monophosphate kinase [Candidatus Nomurabacteria bacterium]|nr:MAG: nucleoside monophosphate kinase [Candidatus Nomurabacteria bacterium]
MQNIIGLYGDTCSGKSTLGQQLSEHYTACQYLSYGDLKRALLGSGNKVAVEIASYVGKGKPIPVELSTQVLEGKLCQGINLVSGYPISENEVKSLKSLNSRLIGIVEIKVSHNVQQARFFDRVECPVCYRTGKRGDLCSQHQIPMVTRSDLSSTELRARNNLYDQRIVNFLRSTQLTKLPRIVCNGDNEATSLFKEVAEWLYTEFAGLLGKGE